jgi:hypothetical protein
MYWLCTGSNMREFLLHTSAQSASSPQSYRYTSPFLQALLNIVYDKLCFSMPQQTCTPPPNVGAAQLTPLACWNGSLRQQLSLEHGME